MERSIEFILQQQVRSEEWLARFEAKVERSIESLLDRQAKHSSDTIQLRTLGAKLAKSQLLTEKRLADSHEQLRKEIAASHRQLTEQIAQSHRELAEVQKKTELKLNAFITALERRFGGNGRGRKLA
jgi:hypothetical protein